MGTRSLTYVFTERNEFQGKVYEPRPLICMYRQFDGYPTGHGRELAEFLDGMKVVNGLGSETEKLANGMGCLAAQLVANFKVEAGQFYMEEARLQNDCGQEFEYHVYADKVEIIKIGSNNDNVIFSGTWAELKEYCSKERYEYTSSWYV